MDQWELVNPPEITPISDSDEKSVDTEVDEDEQKANQILSEPHNPTSISTPEIIPPIVKKMTWYAAKRMLSSESFWLQATILTLHYASHVDWRIQAVCTTISFLMIANKYRGNIIF